MTVAPSFGAGSAQVLRTVALPGALPGIVAGLRQGLSLAIVLTSALKVLERRLDAWRT